MTGDGDTAYAFTEDVAKRLEACEWHTTEVQDGNYDIEGIAKAIQEARAMHDKPSLIKINTTIGKAISMFYYHKLAYKVF